MIRNLTDRITGVFCVIILFGIWSVWTSGYRTTMSQLPAVQTLEELYQPLGTGESRIIGRAELMQRTRPDSAEPKHLLLTRDRLGNVRLANIAGKRRVFLRYEDAGHLADESVLRNEDKLFILGTEFLIKISNGKLVLTEENNHPDRESVTATIPAPFPNDYLLLEGLQSSRLSLGGSVETSIANNGLDDIMQLGQTLLQYWGPAAVFSDYSGPLRRVAIPGLPENALEIRRNGDRFVARRGSVSVVKRCNDDGCEYLGRQNWPLIDMAKGGKLEQITVGRSSYAISHDTSSVTLRPLTRQHWWPVDEAFRKIDGDAEITLSASFSRGLISREIMLAQTNIFFAMFARLMNPSLVIVLLPLSLIIALSGYLLTPVRDRPVNGELQHGFVALCLALTVLLPLDSTPGLGILASRMAPSGMFLILHFLYFLFSRPWRLRLGLLWLISLFVITVLGVMTAWGEEGHATAQMQFGDDIHIAVNAAALLYFLAGVALLAVRAPPVLILFWIALSTLVGFGTISGAKLALGQEIALHVRLLETHLAVMGLIAMAAVIGTVMSRDGVRQALSSLFFGRGLMFLPNYMLAPLVVVFSFGLAVLTILGTEEGIGGFQPTELSKSLIVVVFAMYLVTMSQLTRSGQISGNIFWTILVLALSFSALMIASFANFDLSPILIVNLTLASILILYSLFVLFRLLGPGSVILVVLGVGLIIAMLDAGAIAGGLILLGGLVTATALFSPRNDRTPELPPHLVRAHGGLVRPKLLKRFSRQFGNPGAKLERLVRRNFWGLSATIASLLLAAMVINITWPRVVVLWDKDRLETFQTDLPRTPTERVVSWYDSTLFAGQASQPYLIHYPDFSYQVRLSREVLAVSTCDRAAFLNQAVDGSRIGRSARKTGWLDALRLRLEGLCRSAGTSVEKSLSTANEPHPVLYRIPAIQDDFVATFFIASFGMEMMLLLVAAQILLLVSMFLMAISAIITSVRNPRLQGHGQLAAFAIGGFAIMLGLQFLFSWANVFGLLPVVGQPMTFLSFGGSHHLLLALPVVLTTIILGRLMGHSRDVGQQNRDRRLPFGRPPQIRTRLGL